MRIGNFQLQRSESTRASLRGLSHQHCNEQILFICKVIGFFQLWRPATIHKVVNAITNHESQQISYYDPCFMSNLVIN